MRIADFFGYAKERESVRLHKEAGDPKPWTNDEILQNYKFTNVRRENDRTSQALIQNLYHPNRNADAKSILLNCAIARYFGTSDFALSLGWIDYADFDALEIVRHAKNRIQKGMRVFTGAYVITNGGISAPKEEVVVNHYIAGIYAKLPDLVGCAQMTRSWSEVARVMRTIPGFGGSGFMTKETLVDTTYTNFWNQDLMFRNEATQSIPVDWSYWTPVGPGARRGIARLLGHDDVDSPGAKAIGRDEVGCLGQILHLVEEQENFWDGGPLSPHDIQFGLCEFDKYERVRLGQGTPRSRYKGAA